MRSYVESWLSLGGSNTTVSRTRLTLSRIVLPASGVQPRLGCVRLFPEQVPVAAEVAKAIGELREVQLSLLVRWIMGLASLAWRAYPPLEILREPVV